MLSDLDHFYLDQEEPQKSCFMALRDIIFQYNPQVSMSWKYGGPFFLFKGKWFCYLWLDKKTKEPYIGIIDGNKIEHPMLEQGNRSRMKILRINPLEDIPVDIMYEIFDRAIALHSLK